MTSDSSFLVIKDVSDLFTVLKLLSDTQEGSEVVITHSELSLSSQTLYRLSNTVMSVMPSLSLDARYLLPYDDYEMYMKSLPVTIHLSIAHFMNELMVDLVSRCSD